MHWLLLSSGSSILPHLWSQPLKASYFRLLHSVHVHTCPRGHSDSLTIISIFYVSANVPNERHKILDDDADHDMPGLVMYNIGTVRQRDQNLAMDSDWLPSTVDSLYAISIHHIVRESRSKMHDLHDQCAPACTFMRRHCKVLPTSWMWPPIDDPSLQSLMCCQLSCICYKLVWSMSLNVFTRIWHTCARSACV